MLSALLSSLRGRFLACEMSAKNCCSTSAEEVSAEVSTLFSTPKSEGSHGKTSRAAEQHKNRARADERGIHVKHERGNGSRAAMKRRCDEEVAERRGRGEGEARRNNRAGMHKTDDENGTDAEVTERANGNVTPFVRRSTTAHSVATRKAPDAASCEKGDRTRCGSIRHLRSAREEYGADAACPCLCARAVACFAASLLLSDRISL